MTDATGQALPIARVTVHRDGALVERRGPVAVRGGTVAITGLPLLLEERTVRVALTGARLVRVESGLDVAGAQRADESAAVVALREAEEALATLGLERDLLQRQRDAIASILPADPDDDPERVPDPSALAAWADVQEALYTWSIDVDEALHPLHRRIEEAEETRRRRARELERLSSEAYWRRWAPTRQLLLHVADGDTAEAVVSYRVAGATWAPAYALHTDAQFRAGRLVVRALVAQATGEDWTDVALALSTAPCRRSVDVPELPALRLGSAGATARSDWRELPADLDALFPQDLSPPPPPSKPKRLRERAKAADPPRPQAPPAPAERAAVHPVPIGSAMPAAEMSRGGGLLAGIAAVAGSAFAADEPEPADALALEQPPALAVRARALDYPALRLAAWDAPAGVRGRLQPGGLEALAREAGMPAPAITALDRHRAGLQRAARGVTDQPLPPDHVLPGPIDGADFRWDARDTVDVVADGQFHSIGVFAAELSLSVAYRVVPHHDPRAFRTVTARLAEPVPLLPGPVDAFVDGALEISTPWGGSGRGADLELGLGPEDRIRVARNVRYREETAGLLRNERRLHTEIAVDLASGLARAVEVEVLSRTPVPVGDGVEVRVVASAPKAEPFEGDPDGPVLKGGLRQVVPLGPGGEASATVHYAVTLSARMELLGGDRRG